MNTKSPKHLKEQLAKEKELEHNLAILKQTYDETASTFISIAQKLLVEQEPVVKSFLRQYLKELGLKLKIIKDQQVELREELNKLQS